MRIWRFRPGFILRRFLVGLVILSIISCWILVYHSSKDFKTVRRVPVFVEEKCYHPKIGSSAHSGSREFQELGYNATHKVEKRVLVAIRQTSVNFQIEMARGLEENRIQHNFVYLEIGYKTVFPELAHEGVGRYSVVIFESIKFYLTLGKANRQLLDDYCRKFAIGIVLFTEQESYGSNTHTFEELHLGIKTGISDLRNVELNPSACLLQLTRAGGIIEKPPKLKWNVFFPNHSTYEVVEFATQEIAFTTLRTADMQKRAEVKFENAVIEEKFASTRYTTVLTDLGHLDGIRRVYFGSGTMSFWLHKLLFIDALAFLSRGQFAQSLERRIVVDIDDIFVGKTGIRMTKEDVKVCACIILFLFLFYSSVFASKEETSPNILYVVSTVILNAWKTSYDTSICSVMLIKVFNKKQIMLSKAE